MSPDKRIGPLFTDLYELTMAAGYFAHGRTAPATFSAFIRRGSAKRNYLVAAGLEDVLAELSALRFNDAELAYLKGTGLFSHDFLTYLRSFRFTGEVYALPEGTLFFEDEPILEITAPLIEAQIVETFVLNTLGFQTLVASKAARCVAAAQGRPLVDFSLRRTHAPDAGMKVARSTYLAGYTATSNVLAGMHYGIPISGTMAHSFVLAFESEEAAFAAYAQTFPDTAVFLIDTYDALQGAVTATKIATKMKKHGTPLKGVRLDSGDMVALSKAVRKILDSAGHTEVNIIASSGFDEYKIATVLAEGAEIDGFGVGTRVGVSADAPYCDIVYKLVRYHHRNVCKYSPGKVTLAGEKQVFRKQTADGLFYEDVLGTRDDTLTGSTPLLKKVMADGQILGEQPNLEQIRGLYQSNYNGLDKKYTRLTKQQPYPVKLSPRLTQLQKTER